MDLVRVCMRGGVTWPNRVAPEVRNSVDSRCVCMCLGDASLVYVLTAVVDEGARYGAHPYVLQGEL